ncbi:kinase-like domain-containing protein [Scenedesmus sp. NREL 46B-D3]|nr:kinase-like domain-containing protein [Scenedesmus sp. NREL 46B-D3]
MYVPSDSFGGISPERKASQALQSLFTFISAKVVLAQLEGSGRGALASYNKEQYQVLFSHLQEASLSDSHAWLEQLMRKDKALAALPAVAARMLDAAAVTMGRRLGCGAFATVYAAQLAGSRAKGWFVDSAGVLCLLLGHCEGGTLAELLRSRSGGAEQGLFEEDMVMCWDLKPDNVLLSGNLRAARLADFGVSKQLEAGVGLAVTCLGTPHYMSPEVISRRPYTFASDMWALGAVLYEMAARRPAFDARGLPQLVVKILRNAYMPLPLSCSRPLQQLVGMLLRADPDDRPTTADLLATSLVRKHLQLLLGLAQGGRPSLRAWDASAAYEVAQKQRAEARYQARAMEQRRAREQQQVKAARRQPPAQQTAARRHAKQQQRPKSAAEEQRDRRASEAMTHVVNQMIGNALMAPAGGVQGSASSSRSCSRRASGRLGCAAELAGAAAADPGKAGTAVGVNVGQDCSSKLSSRRSSTASEQPKMAIIGGLTTSRSASASAAAAAPAAPVPSLLTSWKCSGGNAPGSAASNASSSWQCSQSGGTPRADDALNLLRGQRLAGSKGSDSSGRRLPAAKGTPLAAGRAKSATLGGRADKSGGGSSRAPGDAAVCSGVR